MPSGGWESRDGGWEPLNQRHSHLMLAILDLKEERSREISWIAINFDFRPLKCFMNYKLKTRQAKPFPLPFPFANLEKLSSSCDSRQRFRQRPTPRQMPATDSSASAYSLGLGEI